MSFLTGTNAEVIYCMPPGAGQTLSTFTTAALLSPSTSSAGGPACKLPDPATLWGSSNVVGKVFRFNLRGTWGDTTVAPTFQFSLSLDTTQGSQNTALQARTGAITAPTVSISNAAGSTTQGAWEFECDMVITAVAMSSAGALSYTVNVYGQAQMGSTTQVAGAGIGGFTGTNYANTLTLVSASTYWPELFVACGTSNAANAITLTQFQLWGMN